MAKRKYTKRSEYWDKFNKSNRVRMFLWVKMEMSQPDLLGEPFYTSDASYNEVSKARRQSASTSGFGGARKNRAAFVNLKR
jgi:hypothetical protein